MSNSLFECGDEKSGADHTDNVICRLHDDFLALLSHPHDVYTALSPPPVTSIAAAGALSAPITSSTAAPQMSVDAVDSVSVQPPKNIAILISKDWGDSGPSESRRLPFRIVLCNIGPAKASEQAERQKILVEVQKYAPSCQLIRWKGDEVLLSFGSKGELASFCVNKPDCINLIKPAIEAESTYPCAVAISPNISKLASVGEDYSKALLAPFGGDLFVHILDGGARADLSPPDLPRHMIQLTLSLKQPKTQSIHQAMEAELSKKEKWTKIDRDIHKLENTQMYRHQSADELAVGVKLSGSDMASSTRFILNVSSPEKMESVCEFYSKLLQNQGVPTSENNVEQRIYPLSRNSEFVIRCDAGVTVSCPNSSTSFCFRPKSIEHMLTKSLSKPSSTGWRSMPDTDDNTVLITVPMS